MARRTWSPAEIALVATHYPGEGPSGLARQLGRSEDSVSGLARRFGLRSWNRHERAAETRTRRNANLRPDLFDHPTPAAAHALGFILGCGRVKTHPRKVLKLSCRVHAGRSLDEVLAAIGSRHAVRRGERRIRVEVGNGRLVDGLQARFGRLSWPGRGAPFPTIPDELLPDFVRGLLAATQSPGTGAMTCSLPAGTLEGLCRAMPRIGAPHPEAIRCGEEGRVASWSSPGVVEELRRWLEPEPDAIEAAVSGVLAIPATSPGPDPAKPRLFPRDVLTPARGGTDEHASGRSCDRSPIA